MIILLNEGVGFVKRNMKTRWKKTANSRIEMPDYCERSVFEALVNALIHRDYTVLGSEVHIDIYDDRLTIHSPGGMADGTRNVAIAADHVAIEVAIGGLNATQATIEKAKAVFANMGVDGIFGRSDVAAITNDSVTAAGNLINKLKNTKLIEPISGFGKGKYKFVAPKE